jgi:PfaB family protein
MQNRIAIVGMETAFGKSGNLDLFEQQIYDGLGLVAETMPDYQDFLQKVIVNALCNVVSDSKKNRLRNTHVVLAKQNSFPVTKIECRYFIEEDSLISAFETSHQLLNEKKTDSVVVAAAGITGAAAIVLKEAATAESDQDRIYAFIDAADFSLHAGTTLSYKNRIIELCDRSFESAQADPSEIGYMEICGINPGDLLNGPEAVLAEYYGNKKERLALALGSIFYESPQATKPFSNMDLLAGIVKTSLCLYNKTIPAYPPWKTPEDIAAWDKSPFYVPTRSRTWFCNGNLFKRKAAIFIKGKAESGHFILSQASPTQRVYGKYLANSMPFCFPQAGLSQAEITQSLSNLSSKLSQTLNLTELCKNNFSAFQKKGDAPYALMLVGRNKDELIKEADFIKNGLHSAFSLNTSITTPRGSYFTANPLGQKGKVVFVYPGVGSAYIGLGQDLFHMFPGLYDQFSKLTPMVGEVLKEKNLYPQSNTLLTDEQIKILEKQFRKDIMAVSECGIAFSILYSMISTLYFKLRPDFALGYSMGEAAMLASLKVWQNPSQLSVKLRTNSAIKSGLHGKHTAVRKSWDLKPAGNGNDEVIWESFTLFANRDIVKAEVDKVERVYLTLVNTDNEVVIAGDPEACEEVAKKIGCEYFPLRLNLAIHSEPAHFEYDNLVDLYTLPVEKNTKIKFYSSSCYMPVPLYTRAVAHSIAKAFCDPVDFPKLVKRTWDDGGRVYIEAGPRQTCSLWIEEILKGREAVAVPLNIKGRGDHRSLSCALAQLVAHRVKMDISCLFNF